MANVTEKDEERARAIASRHFHVYADDPKPKLTQWAQDKLTTQIATALAEQRERDAVIAENADMNDRSEEIAAAIRRGD